MIEFRGFGKISRLFRQISVTEKLDGSQGAIGIILGSREEDPDLSGSGQCTVVDRGGFEVNGMHNAAFVYAQSRKRLITPDDDNFGFARWVWDNAGWLVDVLGEGLHFGEWYGNGIQRGYGLPKGLRRFALFNTRRWSREYLATKRAPVSLDVVPVLYEGEFSTVAVEAAKADLRAHGSYAVPGFMNPEGVVVYHHAGNTLWKSTLDNDELPKALAAQAAEPSYGEVTDVELLPASRASLRLAA